MKTKNSATYRLILVLMLCSLTSSNVFAQYAVMEVVEVPFTSQTQYNDDFTAYMNVDVWIELNGPNSKHYKIPVFWDGGKVFRARLVATSVGNWTWNIINATVKNSDLGFMNKNGSFTAIAADPSTNPNNHGFIRVADNNRTLQYADGTPFFYTADTSWSALTKVFGYENANDITEISFQDYISARKGQGFNGLNVIASFPNDTKEKLWSTDTYGQKTSPNGATPFQFKEAGKGEVDYQNINPTYWQSVDIKMQHLADQGFVTLFETVRRSENWPFRAQDEKNAFYNYVRYLWARYGCYNMIFSWVHHDSQGSIYPNWLELVEHANDELYKKIDDYKMPYGQPRTSMTFNTSLNNWERDVPEAIDIQNVSNAERDETMHEWLSDIYENTPVKPALNLEPFYPGWGLHSSNEINPGLDDTTMAQMQMYGSVLSGGLAGHAWGDAWYAGAAHATGRKQGDGGTIVPNNNPQVNALNAFESQAMGHLKSFILDPGHEYHRLIPAADTHLSDSKNWVHTLSISDDKAFALGFFIANSSSIPNLIDLIPSKNYLFEWYNVTTGVWTSVNYMTTTSNGVLTPPTSPDSTKSWAYRIRSEDYVDGETNNSFALRINTGGSVATYNGKEFIADRYSDQGTTLTRSQTGLEQPYQSFRYSRSKLMNYHIPLENGEYTINLHFAELWFGATGGGAGGVGSRVFDVNIEGNLAEDNLDVYAEIGAQTSLVKTHTITVTDGELNIAFDSRTEVGGKRHPIINAIEILGIEDNKDNETLVAVATANVLSGSHPLTVQFSGSSSSDDTGIASYSWDFGDGVGSSTKADPSYTFTKIGSYQVQLTVTNEEGLTDSATLPIVVTEPPVEGGLVGHWLLDELNGVSANDVSGKNYTGKLHGLTFDTNKTSGKTGSALEFKGSNDRISLPDIDNDLRSGFSVSAWVKPSNAAGGYQGIVGSSTSSGFMMFIKHNKLAFKVTTNENGYKLRSKGTIQNNVWQMITCTFDGSAMHFYIDGQNIHSEALSGTVKDKGIGWIGWSGWSDEYFEGAIEDVRLYNNALTEQQVVSLFDEGSADTKAVNLVAKWKKAPLTAKSAQVSHVFPNPTTGKFRITGISAGAKEIVVTDFSSRVLITLETDKEESELDLSAHPDGIYLVKVLQNGLEQIFKVVKK